MYLFIDELTHSAPVLVQQLERHQDIQEHSELSNIRGKAGGAAFFQTEVLVKSIVSLLSLPSSQHADAWGYYSWISVN